LANLISVEDSDSALKMLNVQMEISRNGPSTFKPDLTIFWTI